jgi:hypothetical protein
MDKKELEQIAEIEKQMKAMDKNLRNIETIVVWATIIVGMIIVSRLISAFQ